MRYFSMFSGVGGFEYGIQRSSRFGSNTCECVGFSEIDKYAIECYRKHYDHKNYGDATKIVPEELPDFDMLCGGFPCQSFSIAGKRLGFEDTRGTLFFDIARIAKVKRPQILFLENVAGLLSHDNGRTFATILATLDELGYNAEWEVLNSKYFGVPQNRERVFIIGHLGGTPSRQVFPLGQSCGGDSEEHREREQLCLNTLKARDYKGGGNLIKITRNRPDSQKIYDTEGVARTLKANGGGQGAKTGLYSIGALLALDLYNNKAQEICPTLKDPCHNDRRLLIGNKIRRLTPVECELLQAFPKDWTKYDKDGNLISDTQRYRMMGNAVTTSVITAIMERIYAIYNNT